MTVKLYRYGGKDIAVNKVLPGSGADYLSITADYGFEGNQDVNTPSIIIESATKPTYNYAYIQELGRYYFVTSCVWLSGQLWRLNLRCDVLKTYQSEIYNQSGTVLYSGSGDSRRYDPRLVYNMQPVITAIDGGMNYDYTGDDAYIVMACRYMQPERAGAGVTYPVTNQMQYYIFSPNAYAEFIYRFALMLTGSEEQVAIAISNTICSVTVVRWLDLTPFTPTTSAIFMSPEIYKVVPSADDPKHRAIITIEDGAFYQITAEEYFYKRYLAFPDTCLSYADRKAQRLIDIPYVGQVNLDIDNLGETTPTGFYICAEIGYDFGGNQYVISVGLASSGATTAVNANYRRQDYLTFSNGYSANFVTKDSYSAETETRNAQILSMLGTAATGIVSGIITEGATVPATVASLGIGAANFALSEQKIEYQKAASLKLTGTSTGGSSYNALKYYVTTPTPHIVRPVAKLHKKTTPSSTDPTNFAAAYGKPDGEYRALTTLTGTGYAQLGAITLSGFKTATEQEKIEIKNLLMSGVIL